MFHIDYIGQLGWGILLNLSDSVVKESIKIFLLNCVHQLILAILTNNEIKFSCK
jgi:hypothetical protein